MLELDVAQVKRNSATPMSQGGTSSEHLGGDQECPRSRWSVPGERTRSQGQHEHALRLQIAGDLH